MAKVLILLFLTISCIPIIAQSDYLFKNISSRDGLSNDFVRDMDVDGKGFIWIATEEGLNRWTGNGNTIYRENNSGLASNELTTVYYDAKSNSVWAGSRQKGISIFDCHTSQFSHLSTKEGLASDAITDIMPAGDEGLWITHVDNGISYYNRNTHKIYVYNSSTLSGLKDCNRCCRDDNNGYLYVGHITEGMSIINLKNKTVKKFYHGAQNPQSLPGNNVRSIYIDHKKNIWVGTNGGLALFNPMTEEFTSFRHEDDNPQSLVGDNVHHITETTNNVLWIASDLGGISTLDLNNFELKRQEDQLHLENITHINSGLSSPNTRVIMQDKFGHIWIGNHSTGVDFIENNRPLFHTLPFYSEKDGVQTPSRVYSIEANSGGEIWLGGENTLTCWQGNKVKKQWNVSSHLSHAYSVIYSMKQDSQGRLWMGIDDEGVLRYDPKNDTFKRIDLGMENIDVRTFYEDEQGQMWIGSEEGVYISHHDSIQRWNVPEWKRWNPIAFALMQDKQRKIWIGTLGVGIYVVDANHKQLTRLYDGNRLRTNNINQIYRDRDDGLWIATYNGLVYVKDTDQPEQTILYDEAYGLADNHIRAIQQDKLGNIWVSTYTGIACFNVYRQKFYNYDYHNGIPAGGFIEGSATILPDGTICFGSLHGVCSFNPQLINNTDIVSPIQLIACESFDRKVINRKAETTVPNDKGVISLPYYRNTFRFLFTVPDYAQEGLVEYAYQMEGLDRTWYDTEGEQQITFRNIDPGKYIFRVKARLKNGEWDEKNTASIHIVINPPIWATWYAKSLYTLLILCIIYLIFRSYKKRLLLKSSLKVEKNSLEMEKRNRQKEQELHNERLRFYTNIAHELRTPLTLIIGPLEDLKDNKGIPAAFRTKIQTIYRSAVQLLNLINQLMEFRKTETQNRQLTVGKGNLSNLITEIGLRYKELNQNEHVRINVKVEPVQENIYFDADIITIILNNLLSNAIKYTRAGHITLSMHRIKANGISYVEMIVADTGYGIDAESLPHIYDRYYQAKGKHQASGTGIGLALVKSLVDLHHGSLEVESAVEKGTTFRFRIQTDYNYPEALHKEEKVVTVVKEMAEDAEPESAFPILLVVEDNADIREYIANELQDTYKILQANNGKEGLILALRYTPNIIVSDIMMPEMDGIAMCKGIKENMNTSHIPVILLTAKDSIQDKEEGYDSGADSYLTKPFSAKLLRSRIKNLLEMRKRLARQIVENVPSTVVKNTEKRQSTSSPHPQLNRLDEAFLSKLTSLIEDNLDVEKIDTAFMIDCMNMSYSAFYRKVKALTELSPNEFVRKIKLRNSAHLLLTGEHNVSEAASMTGFNNMAHFRDCFKKEYGIPPSEYQKRYRQG